MIEGRVALLPALLLLACSPPNATRTQASASLTCEWRVPTRGAVSTLVVADRKVSFCDEAGFHRFDAQSGRAVPASSTCPAPPASAATPPEVTVRTPDLGPDDIVEIEGIAMSFPIQGHARDWASEAGKIVILGTASEVLEIVPATDQRINLSASGAERVAVGGGWAAWWDGAAVIAHRL